VAETKVVNSIILQSKNLTGLSGTNWLSIIHAKSIMLKFSSIISLYVSKGTVLSFSQEKYSIMMLKINWSVKTPLLHAQGISWSKTRHFPILDLGGEGVS